MKERFPLGSLVIAIAAVGCAGFLHGEQTEPSKPRDRIRNVILISLDTVRWDAVSAYIAPEVNTPNIGALASEGVVFEYAFAPMPITLPSHASMFTGLNPPVHGVLDNARYTLGGDHVTLAEVLKKEGFNTAAFVSALVLDSEYGLSQGFDHYDDSIPVSQIIGERRGDETTRLAIEWIGQHQNEKNFVFLHLFDPHAPYEAPEPFRSKIKDLYEKFPPYIQDYVAEIAFVDHCVGMLVKRLRELGLYDSSLIWITSDHGESHGEHGENTHGFFLYTSTTRVPMVVKAPGVAGPERFQTPAGIVDIAPTICGFLGIDFSNQIQGKNLHDYLKNENEISLERYLFMMSIEPAKYGGNILYGLVKNRFHFLQSKHSELYDYSIDLYEKKNLVNTKDSVASEMRGYLEKLIEKAPSIAGAEARAVDSVTRDRLEALGYVTEPTGVGQSGIDARDLIEYHKLNLIALTYGAPENRARALEACDDMIRTRPDYPLGYELKARVLEASGDVKGAKAILEQARSVRDQMNN